MSNYFLTQDGKLYTVTTNSDELMHFGVKGMKWGVRKEKYASMTRQERKNAKLKYKRSVKDRNTAAELKRNKNSYGKLTAKKVLKGVGITALTAGAGLALCTAGAAGAVSALGVLKTAGVLSVAGAPIVQAGVAVVSSTLGVASVGAGATSIIKDTSQLAGYAKRHKKNS